MKTLLTLIFNSNKWATKTYFSDGDGTGVTPYLDQLLLSKAVVSQQLTFYGSHLHFAKKKKERERNGTDIITT